MAYSAGQPVGGGTGPDRKFVELLISDLISLSYETKRKYPPVKEVMIVDSDVIYFHTIRLKCLY